MCALQLSLNPVESVLVHSTLLKSAELANVIQVSLNKETLVYANLPKFYTTENVLVLEERFQL